MALDTLLYGVGVPILSMQAARGGLDIADTGLLFATFAGTQVVALLWALRFASSLPPQRVLGFGFVGVCASMLAFALSAEWVPGLFVGRALHGLGGALVWVGGPALVSRFYADDERGGALGTVLGASAGGSLIGPLMGGALYDEAGFAAPFWAALGLAGLAAIFIAVVARRPTGRRIAKLAPTGEAGADLWRLVARPEVAALIVVIACGAAGLGLLEPLLPSMLVETLGTTGFENGIIFGVAILCYGLTAPVAGHISDRIGRLPVCVIGLGVLAASFALIPFGASRVAMGAIASLAGVGLGMGLTPTMPGLADAAEKMGDASVGYAAVFALHTLCFAAGGFAGPSLGGQGVARFGTGTTFALACGITLLLAAGAWALGRRARP